MQLARAAPTRVCAARARPALPAVRPAVRSALRSRTAVKVNAK
jgi:hypothetical protein